MLSFSNIIASLAGFWKDEEGNEVVTWVIIAALAVVIAVGLLTGIGGALESVVQFISTTILSATVST